MLILTRFLFKSVLFSEIFQLLYAKRRHLSQRRYNNILLIQDSVQNYFFEKKFTPYICMKYRILFCLFQILVRGVSTQGKLLENSCTRTDTHTHTYLYSSYFWWTRSTSGLVFARWRRCSWEIKRNTNLKSNLNGSIQHVILAEVYQISSILTQGSWK